MYSFGVVLATMHFPAALDRWVPGQPLAMAMTMPLSPTMSRRGESNTGTGAVGGDADLIQLVHKLLSIDSKERPTAGRVGVGNEVLDNGLTVHDTSIVYDMILDYFLQRFNLLIIYINISKLRGSSLLPSYLHGSPGAGRRVGGAGQEARSGQTSAQEDTLYIPVMFLKIETPLICFVFLNY